MKTIILVLVLVVVASAIPKPNHFRNLHKQPLHLPNVPLKSRIINDHEAAPNQIPYQAFIEFAGSSSGWYCGGVLISENYILTSANCGDGAKIGHVTLGALRVFHDEDSQEKLTATNIIVHPGWDKEQLMNDIALVEMPETVELSEAIDTITLPNYNNFTDLTGQSARLSGWGLTSGVNDNLSEILNFVDMEIISNEECKDLYGSTITHTILCTSGEYNFGFCKGDAGGPLAIDDVLVGIASFTTVQCIPGYPSGFTRITSFLEWIEDNSDVKIS